VAEVLDLEEEASGEGQGRGAHEPGGGEATPHLRVEGYEGPLDFLLEMVRRQRVDLGPLSILTLTDQLVGAIENSGGDTRLERRADWLVMASQLLLLKAQLLAPASPEAAREADEEARQRLAQLDELARMRAGAAWLAARPQLGREVFARVLSEPPAPRPQAELYVAFLEATLAMLEGRDGQGTEAQPAYRPTPPDLWRIPDAMLRITAMLEQQPRHLPFERCLPAIAPAAPDRLLRFRAALASTLLAGLELTREGKLSLTQEDPFGPIALNARGVSHNGVQDAA
jgi:segregation and condensation protein A